MSKNPSTLDTVAVFTQNFTQVFSLARILKPIIKESAQGMESPLESGAITTDHVIINPYELELPVVVREPDLKDTYNTIRQYFLNSTLLIIQTKTAVYTNVYISSMPHEEDPDQADAVVVVIMFKQALITKTQTTTAVPSHPSDTNTVQRGTQQAITPPGGNTVAIDLFGRFL